MADNQLISEIENALTELVKLMKALRLYPKGHPSLRAAIDECMSAFQPMLNHQENRAIQVNQSGFTLGPVPIGETNQALPDLARMLAERRVNQLIFLPGLPPQEILVLLEGITTSAEEIYRIGGLPAFLHERRVTTIWLNESSLDRVQQKRRELAAAAEENPSDPGLDHWGTAPETWGKPDMAQQLRDIIDQLNTELSDDAYRGQIDKLLQIAPAYLEQTGPPGALRILPLLLIHSRQQDRRQTQRTIAQNALERLLTDQLVDQLLAQFSRTALTPQQFQRLKQFVVSLGTRIAPQLLARMSNEEDGTIRKRLTSLLGKMGEPLLDLLRETVHSSKWYVVRNAVTLLGDLRLDAGISILAGLTSHPDQRVRRALIRSLAMIGGDKTVPPLYKLTQDPAVALRRPAVKGLGATRSPEAVRPLLAIAQKLDPLGRQTEIRKDAVTALGILGDKGAVTPLKLLAKRPNMLRLQRLEELRAEIILTLGKLGDETLTTELEAWRKSPHGIVQRAAEQSLSLLTKKHDHSTAD